MRDIMVKYLKPHTYNYKGTKSVTFMQKTNVRYFSLLWYDYSSRKCGKWKRGIYFFLIKIETFITPRKVLERKI